MGFSPWLTYPHTMSAASSSLPLCFFLQKTIWNLCFFTGYITPFKWQQLKNPVLVPDLFALALFSSRYNFSQPSLAITNLIKCIINLVELFRRDVLTRDIIPTVQKMQIDTQISAASNLPISISQRHVVPFRVTTEGLSKLMRKAY